MNYDNTNIFAKFIRGEIPVNKIYEDEFCIAFPDIKPAAKNHILVVPKFDACSFDDFVQNAKPDFISGFYKAVQKIAKQQNLTENGYRIIFNHGKNAHQTVFHFHVHILGGEPLSAMN
jgi:diadenosine tetraphosphate (Ap4A) HIT family hydrolase